MVIGLLLAGCNGGHPAPNPGLSVEQITELVRPDVKDRKGWAVDARAAVVAAGETPDKDHVCQVLAIVEQESGYQADPAVPGLPRIARTAMQEKLALLGPVETYGLDWLLSPVPEGQTQSFSQRLDKVHTEHDLDLLFRDIVAYHSGEVPGLQKASTLLVPGKLDELNPVKTAGSMQVSVGWAQELGHDEGLGRETIRDLLYTRAGGLKYGAARLFADQAHYDKPIYRFADYNAGLYTSRNASFQQMIAKITGLPVAPDGDLLAWTDSGKVRGTQDGQSITAVMAWRATYAPDLDVRTVRRDLESEKTAQFEDTDTYNRVRTTWRAKFGKEPTYAILPTVELESPKMSTPHTTSWFAQSVQKRYDGCLAR